MTLATIESWLLTYLIHSTILLGAAWAASRLLGERRMALQEIILRTALAGGLVTATIQIASGSQPLGGSVSLGSAGTAAASVALDSHPVAAGMPHENGRTAPLAFDWTIFLVAIWAAGSIAALVALSRSASDLRRLMRTRKAHHSWPLVERLATAMGLTPCVRLSTSKAISVPFATGIRQPEICCPERVRDLAPEHQTSLFAHELAHLVRRDPAWQLLYRVGEAVLVLQPLNRVVRRRLEEIAEHLTDERAVAVTGNRLGLARCLVVVAHWQLSTRIGVPAAAATSGPRLDRRVRRLLENSRERTSAPAWAALLAAALVLAAALTLPTVAAQPADSETPPEALTAGSQKTWSDAEDAPRTPVPPTAPDASPVAEAAPAAPAPPPAHLDAAAEISPAPAAPAEVAPQVAAVPEASAAPEPAVAPAAEGAPVLAEDPKPVEPPEPVVAPEPHTAPERSTDPEPTMDRKPRAGSQPGDRAQRERERAEREAAARERAEARAAEAAERAAERAARHAERDSARNAERAAEAEARALRRAEERLHERERAVRDAEAQARAKASAIEREAARSAERAEARSMAEAQRVREAEQRVAERARAAEARARRLAEEAEAKRLEEEAKRQTPEDQP